MGRGGPPKRTKIDGLYQGMALAVPVKGITYLGCIPCCSGGLGFPSASATEAAGGFDLN
jgi:hypothetical protein